MVDISGEVSTETVVDVRALNDEDFLKMSPEEYAAYVAGLAPAVEGTNQGDENASTVSVDDGKAVVGSDDSASQDSQAEQTVSDSLSGSDSSQVSAVSTQLSSSKVGIQPTSGQTPAKTAPDQAKPNAPADGKPKADGVQLPVGVSQESLVDFYSKITGPIKADGKDINVRTPEDAIRLIQMGFNYSRRMQELKPVRAMSQMLESNGLNDPEKLNFLIDLSKGKKEAIQKLLADHKIDPIDLDANAPAAYKPAQYQEDPKQTAFREAVESTAQAEGGNALLVDINKSWDSESKAALREQPLIFQNLLDQKQSGVYDKIQKELEYQRSLGYLAGIPFIQAYHQVGVAMQNAGVFNTPQVNQVQSSAPANQAPIDTGTRKATTPKNVVPAPQKLSSISQPRMMTNAGNPANKQTNVAMSDADFMKLPPPR